MRIALVHHASIRLPENDQPLSAGSIGIWCYEVARRLPREWTRSVYGQKGGVLRTIRREHDGVAFVDKPAGVDQRLQRFMHRVRPPGDNAGQRRDRLASGLYFPDWGRRVARDIRASGGADVVQVHNFSSIAPQIRRALPDAKIHLHMNCDWLAQDERDWVAEHLAASDWVACCSDYIAERVRERFPDWGKRVTVVPNGVDEARFPVRTEPATGREILFIGRLSPEKGVHVLVEAFGEIASRLPDARLTVIGHDARAPYDYIVNVSDDPVVRDLARFYDDTSVGYADAAIARLPSEVAARVRKIPSLPQAELAEHMQRAAVFAFPSVWEEPFGMPPLEAMASGVPVVATVSGGIPEFVGEDCGRLVARGDVPALAEALIEVLEDPDAGVEMGRAGRARVEASYTWDRVADRVAEQFRNVR